MIALYILAGILLCLLIILLIPIHAVIHFNSEGGEAYIKILFFKIRLYPSKAKKVSQATDTSPKKEDKQKADYVPLIKLIIKLLNDIKKCIGEVLDYIVRYAIKIDELNIGISFGTGDPMYTGILCGAIYPFIYNSLSVLKRNKLLNRHHTSITPDFDNAIIKAGIYARLKTNAMHILVIIFIVLKLVIKFLRLRRRLNKDEQLSK